MCDSATHCHSQFLGMVIAYEINGLGYEITNVNVPFLIHCMLGGITQILFTVLLLWTFSFRSFAVGTAFSKMEVIFIAMLSYPILGDTISFVAVVAIVIGCFGAILLSQENKVIRLTSLEGLYHKSTWIGIASGLFLGASGVFYRGAILTLEHGNFVTKALLTLVVALVFQTIAMGIWFAIFDPLQLKKIIVQWRRAMPIGLIGMITSFCWFTAFALQKATYVRAVGQIELVFTFIATIFFFREKNSYARSRRSAAHRLPLY